MALDEQPTTKAATTRWADPMAPKTIQQLASRIPDSAILPYPKGNKLLVLIDEKVHQIGNIIMPDKSAAPPLSGVVLRVGTGYRNPLTNAITPLESEIGDIVYFEEFAGSALTVSGQNYKLLHEDDCVARMPRVGEEQHQQMLEERERLAEVNRKAQDRKINNETSKNLGQLGLVSS